jgi:predicted transposase/invertase (TIGR01784 family)
MAHLKTKETHNKPEERKTWRYHLTTMLYDQGYGEQAILDLDNFLDWLMDLPEELEKQFQIELKAFEEARQMKYVTTIERMAEERGEERGRVEERLTTQTEIALNMLRKNMSPETIAEVTGLTIAEIETLQSRSN